MGASEILIVMVIAVLLFGKRLPEVARSLGKHLAEFKKGINSIQEELQSTLREEASSSGGYGGGPDARAAVDDHEEATAPKFEPPVGEPGAQPPVSTDSAEVLPGEVR